MLFRAALKRTFASASYKFDLGQCKYLKIKCLSELGWFNNQLYESEGKAQKGLDHWMLVRDQKNLAGVSSLIEVGGMNGEKLTFLQDCGWRHTFMDKVYESHGIDKMLQQKKIDFLFVTHEHHDHFLGIPCVLKHYPAIPLYVPETFTQKAFQYISQDPAFKTTAEPNNYQKHSGKINKIREGAVTPLSTGIGAITFAAELGGGLKGESTIFANIAGKGLVILTGCCHKGILEVIEYAKANIEGGDNIYGIYGGLHLGPYGYLMKGAKETIEKLRKYRIPKVAANHCTGTEGIKAMINAGISLVKGREGNKITDGDILIF